MKAHYLSCRGREEAKRPASYDIGEWLQGLRKKPKVSESHVSASSTTASTSTSAKPFDGLVEGSSVVTGPQEVISLVDDKCDRLQ